MVVCKSFNCSLGFMKQLKFLNNFKLKQKNMNVYTQFKNPMTGVSDWEFQPDNYDYHQEVARAAFADMLHDTERNKKYFCAIDKTIKQFHKNGRKANVLDIGTGTGLLSMMAVKCGADSVTACEAFMPMADCAEKIIEANGMKDKIRLIKKRSTNILVGDALTDDMPMRCNILVTEIFDTELIGEGAISIFNDAHANLLTDDCVVIPHSSIVYAQIAESPTLHSCNKLKSLANLDGDILLKIPDVIQNCAGETSVHDVQLSQLKSDFYKLLTKPAKIFSFDFNSKTAIKYDEMNNIPLEIINNGIAQIVFFWWELQMDVDSEIILSCAPYWAHPDFENKCKKEASIEKPLQNCIPWRDHWIQGIFYLPKFPVLKDDVRFYLNCAHDEYSFWFDINNKSLEFLKRPNCDCGFHLAYSRNRIAQINNNLRNKKYLEVLENEIDKNSVVVSLSEGSLLGLSVIALGAKKCFCFEPNLLSRRIIELFIEKNSLKNVILIKNIEEINNFEEITHVIAEPYFTTSILPWDNFYFGILLHKLKEKLKKEIKFIPEKAHIMVIPVELLDLHKIRSSVENCEGFDMNIFDTFIKDSMKKADANIEAQPMWEYPCRALAEPQTILSIDFVEFLKPIKNNGSIHIEQNGKCNGVVCWVDWFLKAKSIRSVVSTGPNNPVKPGQYISWNMFTNQGIHLTAHSTKVDSKNYIDWNINFQPQKGDLSITFNVKK